MNAVFIDRYDAGQKLAQLLLDYANESNVVVLGLPRGGVPVAYEIAKKLNVPLDVCLVRKLGFPGNREVAMGAVAESRLIQDDDSHVTIVDRARVKTKGIKDELVLAIAAREKAELRWRESCYRHYRPMLKVTERIVIVVDDGMATGLTMHAAVEALNRCQPAKIVIATPVASSQAIALVENLVDDLVCVLTPPSFGAVGCWYENFDQVADREVCDLLSRQTEQNFTESH